jgi:hypothetical protein
MLIDYEGMFFTVIFEGSSCSGFHLAAIQRERAHNFFNFFNYEFQSRQFRTFDQFLRGPQILSFEARDMSSCMEGPYI